ncbi:MAG TPA: hypothetical protein VIL44_00245 [Micromonospora sp.]
METPPTSAITCPKERAVDEEVDGAGVGCRAGSGVADSAVGVDDRVGVAVASVDGSMREKPRGKPVGVGRGGVHGVAADAPEAVAAEGGVGAVGAEADDVAGVAEVEGVRVDPRDAQGDATGRGDALAGAPADDGDADGADGVATVGRAAVVAAENDVPGDPGVAEVAVGVGGGDTRFVASLEPTVASLCSASSAMVSKSLRDRGEEDSRSGDRSAASEGEGSAVGGSSGTSTDSS